MNDIGEATAAPFAASDAPRARESAFVQAAPGPEAPDVRDKGGAQLGMILLILGGGLFWAGVALLAVMRLR